MEDINNDIQPAATETVAGSSSYGTDIRAINEMIQQGKRLYRHFKNGDG